MYIINIYSIIHLKNEFIMHYLHVRLARCMSYGKLWLELPNCYHQNAENQMFLSFDFKDLI